MHILIAVILAYFIIGIGVVTYAVRMDLEDGIKPTFDGILIGLIIWPVLVVFEYYSQSTARKIKKSNSVVPSTKADFGPGYYDADDLRALVGPTINQKRDWIDTLGDPNDPLDSPGYYDDRHFAKATLERKDRN